MTNEELQAIKERIENATYGPWKVVKSDESGTQIGTAWEHPQLKACSPIVTLGYGVGKTIIYINQDNANFIAHARQDVPDLLAEVERLRKALEFYADAEKYEDSIVTTYGYTAPIVYDEGETAREALK